MSMLNNRVYFLCAVFFLFLSAAAALAQEAAPVFTDTPQTAEAPAPAPTVQAPAAQTTGEGPLTVTDIIIDKTDKNAVMARDQAIIEARRAAFQKLAERSMTADEFKNFKPPADETIAALVQDFEIKNEQISSDRYVANFTVRFNAEITNYIKSPGAAVVPSPENNTAATPVAAADVPSGPRDVLVLPYFEDISGKKLLWEDPNPWRDAWQATGNSTPATGLTITVPLGDLVDVSAGSTDAVWAGDYSVLEKLRGNYNASEVALTVANKSGIYMNVDLYIYKDGKLTRKKSITPYISSRDSTDSFGQTLAQVTSAIQSPDPYDGPGAQPEEDMFKKAEPVIPQVTTPVEPIKSVETPVPEKTLIEATMNFAAFTQWLEVQRRLTSISPTLVVEISSLTKNAARFNVAYDGSFEAFEKALADKGLALNPPVVEVDESVLGSDKPTQRPLYEIKAIEPTP